MARATGKRSDNNYVQISGYIPRKLHRRVKVRCEELELTLGDLLESLLTDWLENSDEARSHLNKD